MNYFHIFNVYLSFSLHVSFYMYNNKKFVNYSNQEFLLTNLSYTGNFQDFSSHSI